MLLPDAALRAQPCIAMLLPDAALRAHASYVRLFDEKLQSFVDSAGTTQEAFLTEAKAAEGLHEAYLQIFLAHAEYDTFIELMAEQAEKQQSS